MKRMWIAVTVEENGKYYAYGIPVTEATNILSELSGRGKLLHANVYETKKRMCEIVEDWNSSYKANGTYMFQDAPLF